MKLAKGFITHTIGDTQMMVAAGPASELFHGMVQSNKTAAFIIDCLKKDTSEEEIVSAVMNKYTGTDHETVAGDVHEILSGLRSIHALEE